MTRSLRARLHDIVFSISRMHLGELYMSAICFK